MLVVRGGMKKLGIISAVAAICLASCVALMFVQKDTSPLTGKLKAVTVTKESYVTNRIERPPAGNTDQIAFKRELSFENVTTTSNQSLTITNTEKLQELSDAMKVVRQDAFGGHHSMEGYPMYHMNVTYLDGSTQHFAFTRTEWGFRADTPPQLIKYLDENGL